MKENNKMSWNTMRLAGVTVSVQPQPRAPFSVLKVGGVVDTGRKHQTIVLENALPSEWEIDLDCLPVKRAKSNRGLGLPRKISNLNCVYTGRNFGIVPDAAGSVRALTGHKKLATIVPEVIAPGDFVIFKHTGADLKIKFAGIIRAIPKHVQPALVGEF